MKKAIFPLITILLSFVASLILAEAALRIGSRSVPYFNILNAFHRGDKELGWVLNPSFTARFKRDDFDAVISTDENGFRKMESRVRPVDSATRVLFMGDSFLWGWGVSQGEVFTDFLQEKLGERFRVLNRGVTKYGTVQENILLKKRLPLDKPSLVGVMFFYNDFSDNVDGRMLRRPFCSVQNGKVALNNYPVESPVLGGMSRKLRSYSYVASFLAYYWDSTAAPFFKQIIKDGTRNINFGEGGGKSAEAAIPSNLPAGPAHAQKVPAQPARTPGTQPPEGAAEPPVSPVIVDGKTPSLSADDIRIMENQLTEMRAACESHGAELFVIYAADAGELKSKLKSAYFSAMEEICARLGIDMVDPTNAMRAAQPETGINGEPFYFPRDLHWTPLAHRIAAEVVRDYILVHTNAGKIGAN